MSLWSIDLFLYWSWHAHDILKRLYNNYIFNILEKQEVTEKELYQFIHLLENLEKNAFQARSICKYF